MRLKKIIDNVKLKLSDISNAPSLKFEWKDRRIISIGSSAQYWKTILPELVHKDLEGYYNMEYANIALVSAISIAREVVNMDKRISEIERKINNDITKNKSL